MRSDGRSDEDNVGDITSDKVDAGQDGTERAWDVSPTSDSWTSGIDYLPGGSGDLTGHLGPYNSGDDTDNTDNGDRRYTEVGTVSGWRRPEVLQA